MTRTELFSQIQRKQSYLCVGLDTDIQKIPGHLLHEDDPVFIFNKAIIDATIDYAVAYKPNLAFYESLGPKGLESLQKTIEYLPDDVFTIADAKRGDIGNTSGLYARAFFEYYQFDSVTVAPYMGSDSVMPFLNYPGKWVILLALTSNKGADDFQKCELKDTSSSLYQQVLETSKQWADRDHMMYVVGATQASLLEEIRKIAPDHFLLVPGVGAQGGSLAEVSRFGMNSECGLLVNSSRGIIYASSGPDYTKAAANSAKKTQEEMAVYLNRYL
jgi:orotidine-5'-phosphate decarboxylase